MGLFQNGDVALSRLMIHLYTNNLKNRFFTASALASYFLSILRAMSMTRLPIVAKKMKSPPCQIPDSSGCLCIIKRLKVLSVFAIMICVGLIGSFVLSHSSRQHMIIIGGKKNTEQMIVGEMIAHLIEKKTDLKVKRHMQLDGTLICFEALLSGDIDLYCEYTGTAQIFILKLPYRRQSKGAVYTQVKEEFAKKYGVEWLSPLGFDNRYVVVTSERMALKHQMKTISDFKRFQEKKKGATLAYDSEFSCLPELELLQSVYGIQSQHSPMMEKTLAYLSLSEGGIDAMIAYKTDGLLSRFSLRVLEDDQRAFPPYDMAPIVRSDVLEKHPELRSILELLAGKIYDEVMQRLNDTVEREGKSCKEVAREFLEEQKLV